MKTGMATCTVKNNGTVAEIEEVGVVVEFAKSNEHLISKVTQNDKLYFEAAKPWDHGFPEGDE